MNLANVKITRAIAHDVVRAPQLDETPPTLSDELATLNAEGKNLIAKRLVDTVASGSHCVDVTVEDDTKDSPFDRATAMLDDKDSVFVRQSQQLATALSEAQTAGTIRSGSAIFVQGTCVADGTKSRFLAIIKADSDQALYKRKQGENITLTFVNDMLLGESQRLIKIAFFIEEQPRDDDEAEERRSPSDFSVKVFDHLMSNTGTGEAAAYFFRTFLKCKQADNAAKQTRVFYEFVRQFIDDLDINASERVNLKGDLISHLRGNRAIVEPRAFARDVIPEDHQDAFIQACRESGITRAFTKDTSLVKGKLKRQTLKFSSSVTVFAPSEVFRDSIKIGRTTPDGWTELKIKGSVEEVQ